MIPKVRRREFRKKRWYRHRERRRDKFGKALRSIYASYVDSLRTELPSISAAITRALCSKDSLFMP